MAMSKQQRKSMKEGKKYIKRAKTQKPYRVIKTSRITGIPIMKGSILRLPKNTANYHLARGNIKLYKKR